MSVIIILSVICGVLAVSTAIFSFLYYSILKKTKDNPDYKTQLILSDMFRGNAIIRVERVAPEDLFLRRQ